MHLRVQKILEKFFKRKTIFKYGFRFNSAYKRSTGRVYFVSEDLQTVKIKIPLTYKNRNYKGTMFGGAISSATDPIYMIQLITILGPKYVVWDKAASIKFIRPGNQTLYAEFKLSNGFLEHIKDDIKHYQERTYNLEVNLTNNQGIVYATVEREIYIADRSFYRNKRKKHEK